MILRAIIIYLIGINIMTFLVFGIDKWKARSGKWRIPEATLIGMSIAGGSIGALLGMSFFRHKTQKRKFNLGIPALSRRALASPATPAQTGCWARWRPVLFPEP